MRQGGELGVWTAKGKLASVGVHVDQQVLLHGAALNVFRTETSFVGLRPCGLDAAVDFLLDSPDQSKFMQIGEALQKEAIAKLWKINDGGGA